MINEAQGFRDSGAQLKGGCALNAMECPAACTGLATCSTTLDAADAGSCCSAQRCTSVTSASGSSNSFIVLPVGGIRIARLPSEADSARGAAAVSRADPCTGSGT